eukprot:Phypoly_transcript_03892.p1 GENE.Phypoly_transcript_03892~~Phypoly_transcript_03892.p1  ORF type:complete len:713 (+),score=100.52 Phypoly_transcript_03892:150-2141(+)
MASKGSPSNLVLRLLVRDTKALVNTLHALIFFGLTVYLYVHPQLFLTEVSYTAALFMFTNSIVFVALQALQLSIEGSVLPFIISILQAMVFLFTMTASSTYMYEQEGVAEQERLEEIAKANFAEKSPTIPRRGSIEEIPPTTKHKENLLNNSNDGVESFGYKFNFLGDTELAQNVLDPHIQTLHTSAMRWIGSEVKLFILYNAVVLLMRSRIAGVVDVDFTEFVEGYVQAYTSAIYKGTIVGFGYYGAKRLLAQPLDYYIFGNIVFTIMSAVALVPSFYSSLRDSIYLVSMGALSLQIICMCAGTATALRLRAALMNHKTASGQNTFALSGSADLGYSILTVAKKTANVFTRDQLRRAGVAVVGNLLLWQWEAITIACLPLFESSVGDNVKMSALALNFGMHGTFLFVLQYFRTVDADQKISSRRMWHILLASVFAFLALNELVSMYIAGAGHAFSLASFIFSSRAMLCAWLAYSFYKLKGGREPQSPPLANRYEETLPKLNPPPVLPPEVLRLYTMCTKILKILFSVFVVFSVVLLVRSPDYSGLIGNGFGVSDVGWQSPAYTTAYHFCFILVGMGYQGIYFFNARRLGYLSYCCAGVAAIATVNVTLLMWQYSYTQAGTSFDMLVFAILLCIACACAAMSVTAMWLRTAILQRGSTPHGRA